MPQIRVHVPGEADPRYVDNAGLTKALNRSGGEAAEVWFDGKEGFEFMSDGRRYPVREFRATLEELVGDVTVAAKPAAAPAIDTSIKGRIMAALKSHIFSANDPNSAQIVLDLTTALRTIIEESPTKEDRRTALTIVRKEFRTIKESVFEMNPDFQNTSFNSFESWLYKDIASEMAWGTIMDRIDAPDWAMVQTLLAKIKLAKTTDQSKVGEIMLETLETRPKLLEGTLLVPNTYFKMALYKIYYQTAETVKNYGLKSVASSGIHSSSISFFP